MNPSLRYLLLAIGLFAIALAFCIASAASANVFACALGLAVLPALWMLTGKAELFFAIAYPLTIFPLYGGAALELLLIFTHFSNAIPLIILWAIALCALALVPTALLCLAAIYRPWSKLLSIVAWLWVAVLFLLYVKNPALRPIDYLTFLPACVVLALHAAAMGYSYHRPMRTLND